MTGIVISASVRPPTGAERGRPKVLRNTASPNRPKMIDGTAARLLIDTSIRSVQRFWAHILPDREPPAPPIGKASASVTSMVSSEPLAAPQIPTRRVGRIGIGQEIPVPSCRQYPLLPETCDHPLPHRGCFAPWRRHHRGWRPAGEGDRGGGSTDRLDRIAHDQPCAGRQEVRCRRDRTVWWRPSRPHPPSRHQPWQDRRCALHPRRLDRQIGMGEIDRQRDLRLGKAANALRDHRDQQKRQEGSRQRHRRRAQKAGSAFRPHNAGAVAAAMAGLSQRVGRTGASSAGEDGRLFRFPVTLHDRQRDDAEQQRNDEQRKVEREGCCGLGVVELRSPVSRSTI
ncbi:unnamed protein product [Acanthosepion pharaonis]|uniref:Uncharacterized protein n=1 Tax=Acanthosepion pharaonis TaxID=158019 RepID=A0A812DQI3_ACAPH|nr:unnamed protein product [Sepia pharaonis]